MEMAMAIGQCGRGNIHLPRTLTVWLRLLQMRITSSEARRHSSHQCVATSEPCKYNQEKQTGLAREGKPWAISGIG